jgi:hypothetical protein
VARQADVDVVGAALPSVACARMLIALSKASWMLVDLEDEPPPPWW